jgi:methionyl-tRNA synthetase
LDNESGDNPEVFLRRKRNFEESLEQEAKKLPEKSKGLFHSIAFSVATEKIMSLLQVIITVLR